MSMSQDEIDALINGTGGSPSNAEVSIEPNQIQQNIDNISFPDLDGMGDTNSILNGHSDPKMELLYDLQLPVSIELGRTNMLIRDILRLGRGSVIEFDKLVSEPVDVLINGKKVAEGEVVVIDKHFGIRITTLVDPSDRLRSLKNK